jgi:hypothetical protein
MDVDKVNRWLTLLANVGVIAGIVFLALEVHQNNELLEADARYNRMRVSWDGWQSLAENGDLANLMVAAQSGETLTDVERVRVDAVTTRILVAFEWTYRELPADSPERVYILQGLREMVAEGGLDPDRRVWGVRKSRFDPEFVQWVEDGLRGH